MMRNPGGYSILTPAEGAVQECDTFTCKHCNRVTFVKPKMDPTELGGLCKMCMGLVCSHCAGKPCDVFEKKLERAEASERARRSYGI